MALAGAAPGGWTEFLAGSKGLQVFAVDPAKLHRDVLALPGVLHLQKTSQVSPKNYPFVRLSAVSAWCISHASAHEQTSVRSSEGSCTEARHLAGCGG